MNQNNIRNFCIISHIDHGKSTLADRMLELTETVEKRKMQDQVLDQMELERERGITIKMQPVRMIYKYHSNHNLQTLSSKQTQNKNSGNEKSLGFRNSDLGFADSTFVLNLIDTPGHIDFSYEVSRALKAVEGAILLVDATQGVQAQTLSTLYTAQELGLEIIPALSKVDSSLARVEEVKKEVSELLGCSSKEVLETSGKTGEGVEELFQQIVQRIPPPEPRLSNGSIQGLIFDFTYSSHRGVIVYTRMFSGEVNKNTELKFCMGEAKFTPVEVGTFAPQHISSEKLEAGEVGYIVTGIKRPGIASVGDTITSFKEPAPALEGYKTPRPVVWASIYPESQNEFSNLRKALERLKLTDSSLSFSEETSMVLGRGFHCGFLGMLHLEVIVERLRREFDIELTVTSPTVTYKVEHKEGKVETISSPSRLPDQKQVNNIWEPVIDLKLITPSDYVGSIVQILYEYEAEVGESENLSGNRMIIRAQMPLRELMRGFFDRLKSVSSGFASLSYEISGEKEADVVRIDVLVAEEEVPAFAKIVSRQTAYREADKLVEKLYNVLPKQLFMVKIQARVENRIMASRKLPALKKDVTAPLYGGDVTRKRKLLEKQKEGKKKMKERGKVDIPHEVFLKMVKQDE